MTLEQLAAKVEALQGPDDDIDMIIVRLAFENRWPIASYGGPINYNPELWQERHGFSPTASLDAAMELVPEGLEFSTGTGTKASHAQILNPLRNHSGRRRPSFYSVAATPALALTAASLRVRAAQEKQG